MVAKDGNDAPRHPGRILLERAMAPLGISRNQLARDIDVPVGRISDITNGKRGITADTALRLGRYFGTPAELWLKLQADYDLHVARTTVWAEIAPRVRVLDVLEADPASARKPFPAGQDDGFANTGNGAAGHGGHLAGEAEDVPADDDAGVEADDLVIPPAPEG